MPGPTLRLFAFSGTRAGKVHNVVYKLHQSAHQTKQMIQSTEYFSRGVWLDKTDDPVYIILFPCASVLTKQTIQSTEYFSMCVCLNKTDDPVHRVLFHVRLSQQKKTIQSTEYFSMCISLNKEMIQSTRQMIQSREYFSMCVCLNKTDVTVYCTEYFPTSVCLNKTDDPVYRTLFHVRLSKQHRRAFVSTKQKYSLQSIFPRLSVWVRQMIHSTEYFSTCVCLCLFVSLPALTDVLRWPRAVDMYSVGPVGSWLGFDSPVRQGILLPESTLSADSLTYVRTPPREQSRALTSVCTWKIL